MDGWMHGSINGRLDHAKSSLDACTKSLDHAKSSGVHLSPRSCQLISPCISPVARQRRARESKARGASDERDGREASDAQVISPCMHAPSAKSCIAAFERNLMLHLHAY